MKKVVWTHTAKKSLGETFNFIRELWNDQVAIEFLTQLDYRILQIQKNPEIAPAFKKK